MQARAIMVAIMLLLLALPQIFASTPAQDPAVDSKYPYNLWINVGQACTNDDISVKVATVSGPASYAKISLYRTYPKREFVSEIRADAWGRATFTPKPDGKYQIAASLAANYRDAYSNFEIRPCAYQAAALAKPQLVVRQTERLVSTTTSGYDSTITRTVEVYEKDEAGLRTRYSRVILRYWSPDETEDKIIRDRIPSSITAKQRMLGFESVYPSAINGSDPIIIEWKVGRMRQGEVVSIVYRVEREISSSMARAMDAPEIADKTMLGNATVMAQEGMGAQQTAPQPQTNKPGAEAAIVAPSLPDVPLLAIGGALALIVAAAAGFAFGTQKK